MVKPALDLVKVSKQLRGNTYHFHLDVVSWRKFAAGIPLDWQRVKFNEAGATQVPLIRGVYVFTIEVQDIGLPTHGYIMYFGITGDDGKGNLRTRYRQYLREPTRKRRRPRVTYMLTEWSEDLFFNFMPIPDTSVDLSVIEKSFLNSVIPPVNFSDFDGDIGPARKASL